MECRKAVRCIRRNTESTFTLKGDHKVRVGRHNGHYYAQEITDNRTPKLVSVVHSSPEGVCSAIGRWLGLDV